MFLSKVWRFFQEQEARITALEQARHVMNNEILNTRYLINSEIAKADERTRQIMLPVAGDLLWKPYVTSEATLASRKCMTWAEGKLVPVPELVAQIAGLLKVSWKEGTTGEIVIEKKASK